VEDLIGILILALIAFIILIFILRAILKVLFRGVTKVGSAVGVGVAHVGIAVTEELTGREVQNKENIKRVARNIGSAAGVIGSVMIAADVVDIDGGDTGGDFGDSGVEGINDGGESMASAGIPVDFEGDGVIEGFDSTGDGQIDKNIDGVDVPGTHEVSEYEKADGSHVDRHLRSNPDGITENNLRPKESNLLW
jgi:hypothetical protein